MKEELTIRVAKPEDAKGLLEIYAPYVEKTAITFEYEVPSEEEFAGRIRHILTKYPYLVLEENGELLGYVYAGTFNERSAYDWAVETTGRSEKERTWKEDVCGAGTGVEKAEHHKSECLHRCARSAG